jgi:hypothetical protein
MYKAGKGVDGARVSDTEFSWAFVPVRWPPFRRARVTLMMEPPSGLKAFP